MLTVDMETEMATELKDDATHEEIQEYVDQVVKNVEEDRKGDSEPEKTDSKKVAEDNDKPVGDMTAETDSGSEDTAPEGEETGEVESQEDWLDDDLKAEVAAYGIDEKELADFTNREELERALRFFDRSALEAGRKAMAEEDEPKEDKSVRDDKGRFTPKEEPKPEGQYEVKLSADEYDENLIGEFLGLRDHYESRIAELESRFEEAEQFFADSAARAEEEQFDSIVDSLGHADLFGKSGKEKPKELERRESLYIEVKARMIGLKSFGIETDLNSALVNRVARSVFAEELGKKDLKAQTRKISKQSDKRMGGGATKPNEPPETLREEMRRLYKELDNAG